MSGRHHEDDPGSGTFAVECPGCRGHVAVARRLVGHVAGCPRCRAPFLVPAPLVEEHEPGRREAAARAAAPLPEPCHAPLVFSEPPLPSTRRREVPVAGGAATHEVAAAAPAAAAGATPTNEADEADLETALSAGFAVPERAKTIRSGGVEIELRRLTPEERHSRRARRNLIMLVVGAALLIALVVILGKGGR